jgi:Flp pilus assembly protein TadG
MQGIFSSFTSRISFRERAQAIAEFAIVLPILMMILVGIFEAGRMVFIYAAVNNASREAARYASAFGLNDAPTPVEKYRDCAGIIDRARRSAFFTPLTVTIAYDHGTTASTFDTCDGATDSAVVVNSGTNVDRATITVSATYKPMVKLLPLPTRTVSSISSRTILGIFELSYP